LHAFRVLAAPQSRRRVAHGANDPMLVNSISNHALRLDLIEAFQARGYVVNDSHPDFTVAYYASTKEKLDVTYWDYGYRWWAPWWGPGPMVSEYTQGSVIIDVVNPQTKELLFRGHGVAAVSDDERYYERELMKTVRAIVAKFPRAQR